MDRARDLICLQCGNPVELGMEAMRYERVRDGTEIVTIIHDGVGCKVCQTNKFVEADEGNK